MKSANKIEFWTTHCIVSMQIYKVNHKTGCIREYPSSQKKHTLNYLWIKCHNVYN